MMKCQGKFKYKGLTKRDAGVFKNDKGQEISYKESYALKVDEVTENGTINERIFKIATDSVLVPQLMNKELYSDITLDFEIMLYNSGAKIVPVGLVTNSNNK